MEGWVKLHRALQKWEWYNDSQTLHVFLTVLLNANHEDGKWRGNDVLRGQWITGRKRISQITGISERGVRTVLSRLEKSQELTIKTTNKFSVITVVKWDSYQFEETKSANRTPTSDQQSTTNKNDKKETCARVIDYLNAKTGKSYKTTTDATVKLITSRLKEGFEPEDFKTVIDNQCREWLNDQEMEKYLRPATLFMASKFDGYLQNTKATPTGAYY